MESYWTAIVGFLIPQVIAGLIGGFIGVWINTNLENYGLRLSVLFGISGIIAAGAMAEYMFYEHNLVYLLIHSLLGIVTGIFGSSGIDALKDNSHEITNGLVKDVGASLRKKLKSFINRK